MLIHRADRYSYFLQPFLPFDLFFLVDATLRADFEFLLLKRLGVFLVFLETLLLGFFAGTLATDLDLLPPILLLPEGEFFIQFTFSLLIVATLSILFPDLLVSDLLFLEQVDLVLLLDLTIVWCIAFYEWRITRPGCVSENMVMIILNILFLCYYYF